MTKKRRRKGKEIDWSKNVHNMNMNTEIVISSTLKAGSRLKRV